MGEKTEEAIESRRKNNDELFNSLQVKKTNLPEAYFSDRATFRMELDCLIEQWFNDTLREHRKELFQIIKEVTHEHQKKWVTD